MSEPTIHTDYPVQDLRRYSDYYVRYFRSMNWRVIDGIRPGEWAAIHPVVPYSIMVFGRGPDIQIDLTDDPSRFSQSQRHIVDQVIKETERAIKDIPRRVNRKENHE